MTTSVAKQVRSLRALGFVALLSLSIQTGARASGTGPTVFQTLKNSDPLTASAIGELYRVDLDVDGDGSLDLLVGNIRASPKYWVAEVFVRRGLSICHLGGISLPTTDHFFLDTTSRRFRVLWFSGGDSGLGVVEFEYDLSGNSVREVARRMGSREASEFAVLDFEQEFNKALKRRKAEGDRRVLRGVLLESLDDSIRQGEPAPWKPETPADSAAVVGPRIDLHDVILPGCSAPKP